MTKKEKEKGKGSIFASAFRKVTKDEKKKLMACRNTWRWSDIIFSLVCFWPPAVWLHFMVAIGFRWWIAVGFSLLLSLCAEGPRCLQCLRHLLGLPTHTCHPHPRTASSFGGWGCRGIVRFSHLGRDLENEKVKSLTLYMSQRLQVWNQLNTDRTDN